MHSLASCCTHKGATDAFAPYQRLRRSRTTSCLGNNIDTQSNHFIYHIDASSSCSDSITIDTLDLQPNRSDCNVAPSPSRSNTGIKPHRHSVGSQSKRYDCDVAEGVGGLSHIDPVPHPADNCTFINISTPREIEVKKGLDDDANTVLVKIGMVGDTETGKTSFMAKYGGMEMKKEEKERKGGVALLQKLCKLSHVNIALHIWDLGVAMWQQVDHGL